MDNKYITVITGATSGIGLAITKLLTERNHPLALIARNENDLQGVKELVGNKDRIHTYSCDVSKSDQVSLTFSQIIKNFGSIGNLVNCAGMTHSKPVEEDTEGSFDEEIATNLKGTYLCIMAAYKYMAKNGAIVNISSIRARTGTDHSSPGYAAAKAGIINLTKTFALQLAPFGIRVNCVSPGAIYPTRITEKWSEEKRQQFAHETPLKRLGKPEDIANAVEFLLSEKSSFITGQTLDVNGGAWMN